VYGDGVLIRVLDIWRCCSVVDTVRELVFFDT
jgi:hypothetical protein